jgi:hypothetical protein
MHDEKYHDQGVREVAKGPSRISPDQRDNRRDRKGVLGDPDGTIVRLDREQQPENSERQQ